MHFVSVLVLLSAVFLLVQGYSRHCICLQDETHGFRCRSDDTVENHGDICSGIRPVLYHLNLSFNNITNIWVDYLLREDYLKDIQSSGDIVTLNLSNNALTTIESFTFPEMLRHLDLSHNALTTLSRKSFINTIQLLSLNLAYNNMTVLTAGLLYAMSNLIQFNGSWNKIHTIEPGVFSDRLRRLVSVDLSHNELSELGPWPYQLPYQQEYDYIFFNLSHNHIRRLRNSSDWKKRLTQNSLYVVDLTYNNFTIWLGDDLKKYTQRVTITAYTFAQYGFNMDKNPLICDCRVFKTARDIRNSFVCSTMPTVTCANPLDLKGVNIFTLDLTLLVCNVTDRCPLGCSCQFRPSVRDIHVNCSGIRLDTFPSQLPVYQNIHLDLSMNGILDSKLSWVSSMENISRLNMSHNSITSIDANMFNNLKNLQFLDISYNRLEVVPKTIRLSAASVNLTGNRLLCSCDQIWLSDWLRLERNTVRGSDHLLCMITAEVKHSTRVRDVTLNTLNCNRNLVAKISSIHGVILFLIIISGAVLVKYRYQFKVGTYKIFGYHPLDNTVLDSDDSKLYDLYISCDEDDSEVLRTVKNIILPKLEADHKYDVFVPLREMAVGDSRSDCIIEGIASSRRLVAIVTRGYLGNEWCLYEFDQGHRLFVEPKVGKLIVVLLEDIAAEDVLQEPLRSYIHEKKCLKITDSMFWAKLIYELPVK